MKYRHVPVMLEETLKFLNPKIGGYFIDCTLGGGGYTFEIAKRIGNKGRVVSFDLDEWAIKNAEEKILKNKYSNIILINDNFKNLHKNIKNQLPGKQIAGFDGVVFDLGLSSAQLEDTSRGFSFQLDAPLDMRFGETQAEINSTKYIINKLKQNDLEKILREYGEEKYAKRIAGGIVEARKEKNVKTTKELVEIIRAAVPASYQKGKIHFATRTFQALRIVTNQELESLKEALPQAINLLKKGGHIVVVSYHSLEDRIVKQFFKKESKECLCLPECPICACGHKQILKIINKKIILPTEEEILKNKRARSAKFRVAEKI